MKLTREDVNLASQLFFGTSADEARYTSYVGKSFDAMLKGMLLGEKFHNMVKKLVTDEVLLPSMMDKALLPSAQEWIEAHIPLQEESKKKLPTLASWVDFLLLVINDEAITHRLSRANSQEKYHNFLEFKAFVLVHEQALSKKYNAVHLLAIAKRNQELVGKTNLEPAEFEELLQGMTHEHDPKKFKKLLSVMMNKGDSRYIVPLQRHLFEAQHTPQFQKDIVAFYAARILSRMRASETAYGLLAAAREHINQGDYFTDSEKRECNKLYLQLLPRTGRIDVYAEALDAVCVTDPSYWEWYLMKYVLCMNSDVQKADYYIYLMQMLNRDLGYKVKGMVGEFYLAQGKFKEAHAMFLQSFDKKGTPEAFLMMANLSLATEGGKDWASHLTSFFTAQGLLPCVIDPTQPTRFHSVLAGTKAEKITDNPLVTIVMTTFNAEATVELAVESVLKQTCQNIELYIVDDVSSDKTRSIITQLKKKDKRIKSIFNKKNMGTYCSKNQAIKKAKGEFVTFHDSDDWMHPQRIEKHLEAMQEGIVMSTSRWIRMDMDGKAIVQRTGGYIHDNPASTFMRRAVFEKIGYFDSVRTGADTEMRYRVINNYGNDVIEDLRYAMALGLHREDSLTTNGVAAFDEHRFSAVRLNYWESWVNWQIASFMQGAAMNLPYPLPTRAFDAPEGILP